jgi:hypothetical protein
MANKSKIVGEVEKQVREMCEKGYNPTHIGKQIGLAKDTVKSWAIKNGFELSNKKSAKLIDLKPKILEMLKSGFKRKDIQLTLKVHYSQVTEVAIENGLENLLKNRQEDSWDKVLSDEEVTSRITDGSRYIGYSRSKKKYGFICPNTNREYYKGVVHLDQGSPYGKSGYVLTEEDFKNRLNAIGYTLEPGTYIGTKKPVVVYCSKGHKRELLKASYTFSFNCPVCGNNGTSAPEQEILVWVQQYYPSATKFKFPERKTKPKEIDVYIPELKLGIEFCGLHFHAENDLGENKANENKHYRKMLEANKLGIRLITIFENEWKERKDQIKGFLLSAIGKNEHRIFARDCEIGKLDKSLADTFLNTHHIQGKDNSFISFGLFYGGELVGVITGGNHPHRSAKTDTLYLNRLAFKAGTVIVGGSSRLLSCLVEYGKANGFKAIHSWSDNRWSEGNVYTKLGFTFDSQRAKGRGLADGSIWPDFQYAIGGKLYSRSTVKSMGLDGMDLNKVYDCGKKRWILSL